MARILVVDDDADVLRLVERVLKMGGHDVYTAHDAMKAMDLLNASIFDLLISDANMPRFSGFDLVRTLKNNKRFAKMGIAMLTGLREKKDIEKAIRAGVDDYIVKPIDPAVLVTKIETMLEKKPPMEKASYKPPELATFANAQVTYQARVSEVTEDGMTIRSGIEIPEGLNVQVATDIFKRIDTKAPPMKVISCRKLVEFDYEIKVAFMGINEAFQKKVRAWIHVQATSKKGAA